MAKELEQIFPLYLTLKELEWIAACLSEIEESYQYEDENRKTQPLALYDQKMSVRKHSKLIKHIDEMVNEIKDS